MSAYSVPRVPKKEMKKAVSSMELVTIERVEPQKVVPRIRSRFFRSFNVIFFRFGDRCDDLRILLVLAAIRAISDPEKKICKASRSRKRNR